MQNMLIQSFQMVARQAHPTEVDTKFGSHNRRFASENTEVAHPFDVVVFVQRVPIEDVWRVIPDRLPVFIRSDTWNGLGR